MKNLTFNEKLEMLCTMFGEGAKFVSVTMQNNVKTAYYGTNGHNKALDKKPPFDPENVFKTGVYQMIVNYNYTNSVINQQKREGNDAPEFVAKKSKYNHIHKWLATTKDDSENFYFYAKMESVTYNQELRLITETENRLLTEDEYNQMQAYKKPIVSKETTQISQDVEKIVEPRHFKFGNIRKIKCGLEVEF